MTDANELKAKLAIDVNRLDIQCAEQAELYFDAALELADAKRRLREQENKLEMFKADLAYKIKQDPMMFNMESASDKAVDAVIKSDKQYQALQRLCQAIENEIDIRAAFVVALDHRKRMLQEEVALHGQSYFARVEIPTETAPKVSNRQKTSARIPMTKPGPKPVARPAEPVETPAE